MNVLVYVDLHEHEPSYKQLVKKARKADVIVNAGDFTIFEHGLKKWSRKIDKLGKLQLVIPGNHEGITSVKKVCAQSKHLFFLHARAKYLGNVMFIGFGEGGFSKRDERFEKISKKIVESVKERKKMQPDLKVVFVTHGPPHGTKVDKLGKEYVGCRTYASFIKKVKADYSISGHLHENAGREDKIGNCVVLNPGPAGKIIQI